MSGSSHTLRSISYGVCLKKSANLLHINSLHSVLNCNSVLVCESSAPPNATGALSYLLHSACDMVFLVLNIITRQSDLAAAKKKTQLNQHRQNGIIVSFLG